MESLFCRTTAYQMLQGDAKCGKLSHAYLLQYDDEKYLRTACKLCAQLVFDEGTRTRVDKMIMDESFVDCKFYPAEGEKLTVDGISALIEDTALRPLESNKKLYVLVGFEKASPIVQNKLLKSLEEPPQNVHFLLGVTSSAPLLETIRSRVKTLTVYPFAGEDVKAFLSRKFGQIENAEQIALACGGKLGVAEDMASKGKFEQLTQIAMEICTANTVDKATAISQKYGDSKNKEELLARMQSLYFEALSHKLGKTASQNAKTLATMWQQATLIYALEQCNKAATEVKFNAWFGGLLYNFTLKVMEENKKWLKL